MYAKRPSGVKPDGLYDCKEPPLCKGRWQKSLIFDGGIVQSPSLFALQKSSPLYTRGPLVRSGLSFFFKANNILWAAIQNVAKLFQSKKGDGLIML